MECEICGAEVKEQPLKIVDVRKDPDRRTNKPPPARYAVTVIPFVCQKCGHEQFRRAELVKEQGYRNDSEPQPCFGESRSF